MQFYRKHFGELACMGPNGLTRAGPRHIWQLINSSSSSSSSSSTVYCLLAFILRGSVHPFSNLLILENEKIQYTHWRFHRSAMLSDHKFPVILNLSTDRKVFLATWKDIPAENEVQNQISNVTYSSGRFSLLVLLGGILRSLFIKIWEMRLGRYSMWWILAISVKIPGGVLPVTGHTRRLRPKGVPSFSF